MITQRKIENEYLELLNRFFHKTLYFQHISHLIDKVYEKDVEKYTSPGAWIRLNSAHIICDWTELDDNGWKINFLTGILKKTKT